MAALNWILSAAETLLLIATGICGLIVAICVALARNGFDGHCILFAEVKWCNKTAVDFTYLGKTGSCNFVIVIEVFVSFYALLYALYHGCYLFEKMKEYHRLMLPAILLNTISLIFVFVTACLLSIGFKRFCKSLTGDTAMGGDKSCAVVPKWNHGPRLTCDTFPPHAAFTSDNYFQLFTTAQGAGWFGFLFWLLAFISLIVRRIMYRPAVGDPSMSDTAKITSNMVL